MKMRKRFFKNYNAFKGGKMMKKTPRYLSFLLVLLLCGALIFTSCSKAKNEVAETNSSTESQELSSADHGFSDHEITIPQGPEVDPAMAHFMSMQAKIQFEGTPWGSTPGEITEYMKTQNCLIDESTSFIHGREQIEAFYEQSKRGEEGFMKIVLHYPKRENQPKDEASVYLYLIYFDGTLYHKITLDENGEASGFRSFRYLMHYTGYWKPNSKDYSEYYLTNDDTITYEQIWYSMCSSILQDTMLFSSVSHICGEYTDPVEKE